MTDWPEPVKGTCCVCQKRDIYCEVSELQGRQICSRLCWDKFAKDVASATIAGLEGFTVAKASDEEFGNQFPDCKQCGKETALQVDVNDILSDLPFCCKFCYGEWRREQAESIAKCDQIEREIEQSD